MAHAIQALVLFRECILGSNPLGTVTTSKSGHATVVGGEDPSLLLGPDNILPGDTVPILFGSGTATSDTVFPSATIEAWSKFFESAVVETAKASSRGA